MKYWIWLITVRFVLPFHDIVYKNVQAYYTNEAGTIYTITLKDGSFVKLSTVFTIIEEK